MIYIKLIRIWFEVHTHTFCVFIMSGVAWTRAKLIAVSGRFAPKFGICIESGPYYKQSTCCP